MKKILSLTLALTLILGAVCILPASAEVFIYEETPYYSEGFSYKYHSDGTIKIYAYEGNASHVTFPTELEGAKVTEIWCNFNDNPAITAITIPEGIETCSVFAVPNLEEIIIPDSIGAFYPDGLKDSKLYQNPENWEDGLWYLGDRLLKGYEEKTSAKIKVREGTRFISAEAFINNDKMTEVTLPDSLEKIEANAFDGPNSLTKVNFGKGLKTIGEEAFIYNEKLTEVTFPDSLETIEKDAFNWCKGLSKINFGQGLEFIGNTAFDGCINLEEITLPESLTYLGYHSFGRCERLSKVNLPSNLQFIGYEVFNETPFANNPDIYEDGLLYYDNYLLGHIGKFEISGACNVKEGTKVVADMMFLGCDKLTSITLPDGIQGIGKRFFEGCHSLEYVKLPQGISTICSEAFRECDKLKRIDIPEGVTEIETDAFVNCTSLEYIKLPSTIKRIALYSIGYSFAYPITLDNRYNKSLDNLLIEGYQNTAAEHYAGVFDFDFVDITIAYKDEVLKLLNIPEEDPKDGTGYLAYYREGYKYYASNDEATPDYVLIEAYTNEAGDAFAAELFGEYVLRSDCHYSPATFGYHIYLPETNEILSFEEAYDLGIEGIKNVFTEGRAGELLGDVNYDRKLNVKDATLIQKALAGISEIENNEIEGFMYSEEENVPYYIADFNCDGKMNIRDASAIQKRLAKLDYSKLDYKIIDTSEIFEATDYKPVYKVAKTKEQFISMVYKFSEPDYTLSPAFTDEYFEEYSVIIIADNVADPQIISDAGVEGTTLTVHRYVDTHHEGTCYQCVLIEVPKESVMFVTDVQIETTDALICY